LAGWAVCRLSSRHALNPRRGSPDDETSRRVARLDRRAAAPAVEQVLQCARRIKCYELVVELEVELDESASLRMPLRMLIGSVDVLC
jgi:hypothetical protein